MSKKLFEITDCRCCGQTNPLGLDSQPDFSWRVQPCSAEAVEISSYRIRVMCKDACGCSPQAVVWDSGVINEPNVSLICYAGSQLKPRTRYDWILTLWDMHGNCVDSEVCWFETGKCREAWTAKWISAPGIRLDRNDAPALYLRRKFGLGAAVKSARMYICGLGLYEVFVDNAPVSDSLLEPAYTKYDAFALYRVYDITSFLTQKDYAAVGVVLGNGWYNCFTKDEWNTPQASWRAAPKLLCEIHIEYLDGSTECIGSDEAWSVSRDGPIVFNAIRSGEWYDARKEDPKWVSGEANHWTWTPAIRVRSPGGALRAAEDDPIRITKEITPVSARITAEGRMIADMGQNFAGKVRLRVAGNTGTHFILRYAEELTKDGEHVDQTHLRCFVKEGEFQTEHYIKGTDSIETWTSHFTYHGFRYVELTCVNGSVADSNMTGLVMHTDFRQIGRFDCSDDGFNTIWNMSYWATISNSVGLPTDDPHREKNAWIGDIGYAFEQMLLNFDCARFLLQWLDNLCACQRVDGALPCVCPSTGWGYNWGNGPDWALVFTRLPWYLYRQTGDIRILERYYPNICRHFSFMKSMAVNEIVNYGIGDWCAPFDGPAVSVNMESFRAPVALTDTACFYETAVMIGKMSAVLGCENPFADECSRIKRAFLNRFLNEAGEVAGDCQTSDGCVLYNHMLGAEEDQKLAERLVDRLRTNDWHLDFGILGSRYVMESLGERGYIKELYRMLSGNTYPSYLYLAENGCTTLTECWNLGGSHNHFMFSHVSAILYRYIAGLRQPADDIGWKHFEIVPSLLPKKLDCSFDSPRGKIELHWQRAKETVHVDVAVPFGTTATLFVPECAASETRKCELTYGKYEFEWKLLYDPVLV